MRKVSVEPIRRMPGRLIGAGFAALMILFAATPPAQAAVSCWAVTGWSSPDYVGAYAEVTQVSCSKIPEDQGWVEVQLGVPMDDNLWLRMSLSDSRVTGWLFRPLLVFEGYDANGKPVVRTDAIPALYGDNSMWLLPYPPVQGVPTLGARVRLRHRDTGKCVYSLGQNGSSVYNWACWNDPTMVYVIDNAGGGFVRLRNEQTGKCLYAVNQNGALLYNWDCWADPNMAFALDPAGPGYRLRHGVTGQCAYGSTANGGALRTWACWSDSNMVFNLDILN